MILKSGDLFSEKIMLNQEPKARRRLNQISSRFGSVMTFLSANCHPALSFCLGMMFSRKRLV